MCKQALLISTRMVEKLTGTTPEIGPPSGAGTQQPGNTPERQAMPVQSPTPPATTPTPASTPTPLQTKPPSGSINSPIVGKWNSEGSSVYVDAATGAYSNSYASIEGWEFNDNRTFLKYLITTATKIGYLSGGSFYRGKYTVSGNRIDFSNVESKWINSDKPSDSHDWKPHVGTVFLYNYALYEFDIDGRIVITLDGNELQRNWFYPVKTTGTSTPSPAASPTPIPTHLPPAAPTPTPPPIMPPTGNTDANVIGKWTRTQTGANMTFSNYHLLLNENGTFLYLLIAPAEYSYSGNYYISKGKIFFHRANL